MNTPRAHLSVVASSLVLVALLAGCGQQVAASPTGSTQTAPTGSASAPTSSAAIPTATAAPSPSQPAALSTAAAGKRYLEITRPYNVALEAYERGFNAGESVATLKRRARTVADAAGAEAAALGETRWPTAVATLTAELARIDRRARTQWLAVAAADTREAMLGKVRSLPSGAATGARIRSLLGLPKYDESDY